MSKIKTSITDVAKAADSIDQFGIEPFENGLIKFIEHTNTPITIALQGEWGSGKTSLMNSLKNNLSDKEGKYFHSIWLNTWEYALMKDTESTLLDIISGLIKEVTKKANINEAETKKIFNKCLNIGKSVFKTGVQSIANTAVSGLGDAAVSEFLSDKAQGSISEIRKDLEKIIEKCIIDDKKEGFIFFIDDLDRIDPPVAVELLELLKNIFTLKNCVFILAIDYDVVIKGLEPKFGKLTEANEREFRSFFDKIIQVPFSMPVGSYKVDKFLKNSLETTTYLTKAQCDNIDLITQFSEIANLTVGTNPRALKRLMNSLSLIKYINAAKDSSDEENELNDDLELLVNFALVSIQIAYPPIYRLLTQYPDFDRWDNKIALQMNLKELDEASKNKLAVMPEFDEEWEQVIFRICENDHYLKKKAINISDVLNKLKQYIHKENESIEDIIGAVISLSSVTSIEANDKQEVSYHKGNLLKSIRQKLIPVLKNNTNEKVAQVGKKIVTNFRFSIGDTHYSMNSKPFEGGIRLGFGASPVSFGKGVNPNDFKKVLENNNLLNEFTLIAQEYDEYRNGLPENMVTYSLFKTGTWKKLNYVGFHCDFTQSAPSDFSSDESIKLISNHLFETKKIRSKVIELANKLK